MIERIDPATPVAITLSCDAEQKVKTTFYVIKMSAPEQARLSAIISERARAEAEAGPSSGPSMIEQRVNSKKAEAAFIARLIVRIENVPGCNEPMTSSEEITKLLSDEMTFEDYGELVVKMMSTTRVMVQEGKDSASPSSPAA